MIRNYLKVVRRNPASNKAHKFIKVYEVRKNS